MKKCFKRTVEAQKWPFFIELEGKKEGIIVQKISIFMKLVEKIAQNCQLTDQNSFWNTEKYK